VSWQLIPTHFRGSAIVDILAFRSSDGAFAKWYQNLSSRGDFVSNPLYQAVQYIGGQPGRWSDAQLIPIDFNGDGNVDILAFHPSDGAFAKWYSDGSIRPDFNYQAVRHIVFGPNSDVEPNLRLIPADFNDDGNVDVLAFLPQAYTNFTGDESLSYVNKLFSDNTVGPDLQVQPKTLFIGVIVPYGSTPSLDLVPADFDGDGRMDFLALFPGMDGFTEWWETKSGMPVAPDTFDFWQSGRFIGGGVFNL
jgi:hypothetical protein